MSAEKTDIEKQTRRHKPALAGMMWSVGFAIVLLVLLVLYLFAGGNEPGNDVPIDQESSLQVPAVPAASVNQIA